MSNKVEQNLDTMAEESLLFLVKAFRGAVRMDETENRVLLQAASAGVGSWTRYQATKSQREQTELVRSAVFARDLGGKQTDYMESAPEPKALAAGE